MANHLQRLILTLLAGGSLTAAEPGFSHRVHLKLGLECGKCHLSASTSRSASDNLLPQRDVCLLCHAQAEIRAPQPTVVTRFSHQQHLAFGDAAPLIAGAIKRGNYLSPPGDLLNHLKTKNSCQACHRGLETSDAVTKANYPQMADCLICHPKIDAPFSCETCHEPGPHLKPASHIPGFQDLHSSGKGKLDKPSCVICHGKRFTCLGCH